MTLLLLLAGAGEEAGPPPTPPLATTVAELTHADTRLVLIDPGHDVAAFITDFREFDADLLLFEQGTLTLVVHRSSQCCTTEYNGSEALSTNYGWSGTDGYWRIQYWRRGALKFDGIPMVVKKQRETEGDAYVTITCRATPWELLRRRQVRTEDGSKFEMTDTTWKNVARQLVRENCVAGALVTPTDWQTNTETRDDFANFVVGCPAPSGSGTVDYETEDRTNLALTLAEVFCTDEDPANWLWPTFTESPAGEINVDFLVGRTGGGRQIGSDVSASIVFSTGRRNLTRFSEEADGTPVSTHWTVAGKGIGINQVLQHVADDDAIAALGVIEDGVTVSQAGNATYLLNEGRRKIAEEKAPWQKWEVGIVETNDSLWGTDWDIGDTAYFYDGIFEAGTAMMIVGVKEHMSAPGESQLTLIFGKMQRSVTKDLTRQGGGGRGGRGGGGRTAPKHGAPNTDPDEHKVFAVWRSESGNDMIADELVDVGGATGEDTTDYVEVTTQGIDSGSGSGTEEKQLLVIECHPEAGDPPNGIASYITFRAGSVTFYATGITDSTQPATATPHNYGSS